MCSLSGAGGDAVEIEAISNGICSRHCDRRGARHTQLQLDMARSPDAHCPAPVPAGGRLGCVNAFLPRGRQSAAAPRAARTRVSPAATAALERAPQGPASSDGASAGPSPARPPGQLPNGSTVLQPRSSSNGSSSGSVAPASPSAEPVPVTIAGGLVTVQALLTPAHVYDAVRLPNKGGKGRRWTTGGRAKEGRSQYGCGTLSC